MSRAVTRPTPLVLSGVVLLALLAGCAGEDLGRKNFERTTVQAEPGTGQGQVPTGPIDDPAVALPTLRTVDACGLLGDGIDGRFTPQDEPRSTEWGTCRRDYVDAGGKPISIMVELGEGSVFADQATGGVAGLPVVETSVDETSCYSVAVTQRDPDMGVSVFAQHEQAGGQPCESSYVVLGNVVAQLRDSPPTLTPEGGSLLEFDLCESLDEQTLTSVLGEDEVGVRPGGLHACEFSQDDVVVYTSARLGYPIAPTEGAEEVRLAGEVPAVRRPGTTDTAECDISWNHLPLSDSEAELVSLNYYDYSDDAEVATACERVTALAEAMVATLP
ncbi:hypothetical protein B1813_08620 [Saccharomonospora piscinae]|uniref:DUF3558 domain-containing protein n=1 Tax=Saccharomonospora piscinae TaxID=687388 RepID=A0A1V9A7N0_SACPI|nr:hypothetical protein B1813_08620 [Saccharomonospora piscinae]